MKIIEKIFFLTSVSIETEILPARDSMSRAHFRAE